MLMGALWDFSPNRCKSVLMFCFRYETDVFQILLLNKNMLIFMVIKVHETKNIAEDRLCDVECSNCGNIQYGQPYDFGRTLNLIKGNKNEK
jgi:hypothetical protein